MADVRTRPSISLASVHQLLNVRADASLRALVEHARELLRLRQVLQSLLDAPLNLHCRVGNFRDGVLTLHTDSAAWATRLRCQLPVLLSLMQESGPVPSLRLIRVKVRPPDLTAETPPLPRPAVSKRAAAFLRNVAEQSEDAALQAVLLRLSRRGNS
ncbi:MAG: DUF721 domain-containing protein [Chromatiales bacterium]